jgi:hypothetical protein
MMEFPDRIGENMNRANISHDRTPDAYALIRRPAAVLLSLLIWSSAVALAQNGSQPSNSNTPFSIQVTHLMGFEGAPNNANGTLSIQANALQFQKDGRPAVQVNIASVRDVLLGEESKQIGGLPMTLGKTAAPFGGGRVVSLFAHKKYDTLSLEYVDVNGGFHGAIFQLSKGQGETLRNELVAKGAHVSHSEGESTKQSTTEVINEKK